MNQREKTVILLLSVALIVGIGLSQLKRARLIRQVSAVPIAVTQLAAPVADTVAPGPLDLNSATARQLDVLPGIGPVLAQRIIDYRTRKGRFKSVSQLRDVSGIGPKRYADLKDRVTIGPDSSTAKR
jgi:competence protein ComEA